ncbi:MULTISPECIES: type II secretion system F family protein [unclassified Caballeronia]|uniref:type II secretion system F family protein n=1 Tax=unclassified Caballeronia TaxID=2646786 RepID=UPI002029A8B3|nr:MULTISPECIES: type II secretion system F family protein [unclassified Caballeronia]
MNTADLFTGCAFIVTLLLGVMALVVQDMRKQRPDARIKSRMAEAFFVEGRKTLKLDTDLFKVEREQNALMRWLSPKIARLRTVAGANGIRIVVAVAVFGEIVAVLMSDYAPLPSFVPPLLIVGLPAFLVVRTYNFLVNRFRQRFLDGFPDLIDLIVRAVRAGVPVTHVIHSAASEVPEPLRSEFKIMGDSLQVGLDLEEVLSVAVARIGIADFSFFCVCLLLQRETGGQLGETLENLSGIVRTRREIRQKTKALTGEARITTKILAAIPVIILLSTYLLNREYLMVLFDTQAGQKCLTFAAISLVIGISIVNKMSKMDTSR